MLNVSQAAKELGISADTLRNWAKKGLIDNHRTKGGARRFTRSEIKRVQNELGIEAKILIHGTRVAVTGRSVSPSLFELMAALGKEVVLKRIGYVIMNPQNLT